MFDKPSWYVMLTPSIEDETFKPLQQYYSMSVNVTYD